MRVSRPLPLLLLAAAAASASPQHSASSALSSANHLEARTLGWLWNWATGASRHKCPATFVCDGERLSAAWSRDRSPADASGLQGLALMATNTTYGVMDVPGMS